MSLREKLSKAENLLGIITVVLLFLFILQLIIFLNTTFSGIAIFILSIIAFSGSAINSYLYYSGLEPTKIKAKLLWSSYKFEIAIYVSMLLYTFLGLFYNNLIIEIILTSLLIIEALISYFLSRLAKDKHNQATKIFLIITWLFFIFIRLLF